MADMRGYTLGRFLVTLITRRVIGIEGESGPERWEKVAARTTELLESMRLNGMLAEGTTPKDAYFVVCDQTNNRAAPGEKINIDVGIAPQDAGEFVIARAVV